MNSAAARHAQPRVRHPLSFQSLGEVAALVGQRTDARTYFAWRVAFGSVPWAVVLDGAAAGHPKYELFSMAGELLGDLLAPPDGLDSVVLARQMHYWPRWAPRGCCTGVDRLL